MLRHQYIKWISRVFIFLGLIAVISGYISILAYTLFLIFLILFNFIQAFRIRSGYFLKTICHADQKSNSVALTFDDGPGVCTDQVLDFLLKHQIKATFFVTGTALQQYPELVQRADREGHIIGNHSWFHRFSFAMQSTQKIIREIDQLDDEIEILISKRPAFFRPPFGVITPLAAKAIIQMKIKPIGWSLRTFDTLKHVDFTIAKVERELSGGKIILLHDTSQNVIKLLEQILVIANEKKLNFQRLDNLVQLDAYR